MSDQARLQENAFAHLSTGGTPPDPEALSRAEAWLEHLRGEIKAQGKVWMLPHITVQDGGDVVFEWWQGQKSLSVFVSVDDVWCLQSGGANSNMAERGANTTEARGAAWEWLTL